MYYLAQVNVARMLAPLTDAMMSGFVAQLDAVNALADSSTGFLWRLQTPEGNATALRPFEDDLILVNLSLWASLADLSTFVYKSRHRHVMQRAVSGLNASMAPTWRSGGFPPVTSPMSRRQKSVWPPCVPTARRRMRFPSKSLSRHEKQSATYQPKS